MDRLKTFGKYILWLILFYIFTYICTFIGFNATYKSITSSANIPNQIIIDVSQSTKVNGRIFGKIINNKNMDLNGKYIKCDIFDRNNNLAGTKYLKIENLESEEEKKFAIYFTADNIKSYNIDIVEDSTKIQNEKKGADELFKGKFTTEDLKTYAIIALLFRLIFI